jgi:hypothetical protein
VALCRTTDLAETLSRLRAAGVLVLPFSLVEYVAEGAPDASPRRHAAFAAHACIALWSLLALGPLLPTLAGSESVLFCDYAARCEARDEQRCLREAANRGPSVPAPACLSCIEREQACEAVREGCQLECFTQVVIPEPFGLDPAWFPQ